MLFLVNDILDFAQIEQKNIVLNVHQEVNIAQLILECVDVLKFKADVKAI